MDTQIANNIKLKFLVMVAMLLLIAGVSEAFSKGSDVYKIQALFLYNFTKHVEWKSTDEAFTIGVYGSPNAYEDIKSYFSDKKVWLKEVRIIQIFSKEELRKCHIAYMPKSSKEKILDCLDGADLSNILLVTEDDLMEDGAAISFIYDQEKMKFKISRSKIEEVGLKVSSSLISMGISV